MKTSTRSILYSILYLPVYWAARLFFRRYTVLGKERFPGSHKPVMVVSNHQNALMDPLLCCLTAPKQMHFLTRADVFKSAISRKFVLALNMMPVYRTHDKVDDMTGLNKLTFDVAIERLRKGAAVGIYPEGNHGNRKTLRPFKKGLARLLESAGERHAELKSIELVAVGVDYSDYNHARSKLTVVYSAPFRVDDLLFSTDEQPVRYRKVMERIRLHLSSVMMDHPVQWYHTCRLAEALVDEMQWPERKALLTSFSGQCSDQEAEDFLAQTDRALASVDLHPVDWVNLWKGSSPNGFLVFISALIAAPATILYALPWQVALWLTKKVVRDEHFTSTFKLVFAWLLFPLWTFAICGFVAALGTWLWGAYALLICVAAGLIALPFFDNIADYRRTRRASSFAQQHAERWERWKRVAEETEQVLTKS
ncbi:MAG: hypothetical protein RL226_476 [Bacteroidota bacterium]